MASGYLDLAYLIEISVVFNLAYREIKHGLVLERMKQVRETMLKDKESQERLEEIKKQGSLSGDVVESSYKKLIAIIDCDSSKYKDCSDRSSKLCKAWDHNERYCKYFLKIILTSKGLFRVNASIVITLTILLFATVFPHINIAFYIYIWWSLFAVLLITILIPIYLLYMSEKIGNMLIGKNGKKGLIEELEEEFNTNYNKYLVEQSNKDFI